MLYAILALVIAGFVVLIGWEQLSTKKQQAYPYKKTNALFTAAECAFLAALKQSVGAQYNIFGKVRLADIVQTQSGLSPSHQAAAFNRIAKKHVDFVLCDPCTFQMVCVVELDDRSHQLPDRQKRDVFVNGALAAAGIPIVHVAAQRSYSIGQLRQQIADAIGATIGG